MASTTKIAKKLKQQNKQLKKQNKALKKLTKHVKKLEKALHQRKRTGQITALRPANELNNASALIPYKNRPCKRCPALSGGLCKCAIKKQAA